MSKYISNWHNNVLFIILLFLVPISVSASQVIGDSPNQSYASFQSGTRTFVMTWSPDGDKIATLELDNSGIFSIVIYNAASQQEIQRINNFPDDHTPTDIFWSYDSTRIAIIIAQDFAIEPIIEVWDIITLPATQTVSYSQPTQIPGAISIAWRPNSEQIAFSNGYSIKVLDLATTTIVRDLQHGEQPSVGGLDWSTNGDRLVAGGKGRVFVWDVDNSQLVQFIDQASTLKGLALNDDGTQVATGFDNQVRIWDVATGSVVLTLPDIDTNTTEVSGIVWKGEILAANLSTELSSQLYVWNTNTGQLITFLETEEIIDNIEINPDGTLLVYSNYRLGTINAIPIAGDVTCDYSPTDTAALISTITTANGTLEHNTICLTDSATYTFTTAHIPLNALPAITSEITIIGDGATLTRQAGAPLFGFFEVSAGGNLTLENLTLNGGDVGNDTGGALVNEGGTVTLNNVTFTNNHANTGGAIDNESGSLTLIDSTFENNQADYGGAIDNDTGSTLSISGSTFTSNTADLDGGAIHNDGGTLTVTDSTLTTNTAGRYGGALDNTGSATISGSTFSGNSAAWSGGAIRNTNTLTVTDSVFSNNTATSSYGSLYLTSSSTTTAHNSCFSGNSATSVGFTGTTMQDFTGNWWGAADGPSGAGPGSGDAVNNRINFASFLTAGCPHP
ncbi:MAG: hypothetical protein F9K28_10750 [Bacteroidetes bacterium]|nr:MAG: hypothetical protein F9K28_10750 [Bacteroidota bacterium]